MDAPFPELSRVDAQKEDQEIIDAGGPDPVIGVLFLPFRVLPELLKGAGLVVWLVSRILQGLVK